MSSIPYYSRSGNQAASPQPLPLPQDACTTPGRHEYTAARQNLFSQVPPPQPASRSGPATTNGDRDALPASASSCPTPPGSPRRRLFLFRLPPPGGCSAKNGGPGAANEKAHPPPPPPPLPPAATQRSPARNRWPGWLPP